MVAEAQIEKCFAPRLAPKYPPDLFFFKQKTAYEIQGDWSSDVCSSDLSAKESNAMMKSSTETRIPLSANIQAAWQDVDSSFERFCLTTGLGAIEQMLGDDARQLTGAPYGRGEDRVGYRWGTTKGKIGFHGGKVAVHRPRVRSYDGREV